MPLFARSVADHYPNRERSLSADDHFIVLSGAYEVGGFHRMATGPSEGRWAWGASLGAAAAKFVASGYAKSPDECRILGAHDDRVRGKRLAPQVLAHMGIVQAEEQPLKEIDHSLLLGYAWEQAVSEVRLRVGMAE